MNKKYQYEVIGNYKLGDEVLLKLKKNVPVKENPGFKSMLKDPSGYLEQQKIDALKSKEVEQIRIDHDYWKENGWNIGDLIEIEVIAI